MIKIREIEEFVKYQKHLNKSPSTIISYKNDITVFSKWFNQENNYSFTIYKITPMGLGYKKARMNKFAILVDFNRSAIKIYIWS